MNNQEKGKIIVNILSKISSKFSQLFVISTWNYLWSLKWPSGKELVKKGFSPVTMLFIFLISRGEGEGPGSLFRGLGKDYFEDVDDVLHIKDSLTKNATQFQYSHTHIHSQHYHTDFIE